MKILLIIIYLFFIISYYIAVSKRLNFLNEKHIRHIGDRCLKREYFVIKNIVAILLIILTVLSILVIVTLL